MAAKPVKFLFHIEALQKNRELLLETLPIDLHRQLRDALFEPRPHPLLHFGQTHTYLSDQGCKARAALVNEFTQPLTLAGARGDELCERLSHQSFRNTLQLFAGGAVVADDSRPVQHIEEVHGVVGGECARKLAHAHQQTLERVGIQLERALRALRRAQAERAIDLAAFDFAHQALAQLRLCRAQLIGQPEAAFEEAMVYAAQLADQRSPGSCGFAPRKSGHASDHFGDLYARTAGAVLRLTLMCRGI